MMKGVKAGLSIHAWAQEKGLGHLYTREPMPDDSYLGVPDGLHPFDCSIQGWADRWCLSYGVVYSSFMRGYSKLAPRESKDSKSKHPLYSVWSGMIRRCYQKSDNAYENYGAKGVTVCARWRSSFKAFVEDMGPRPKGYTLDRISNAKGYAPENCRWADWITQANNRTNNICKEQKLAAVRMRRDENLSLRKIAAKLGVSYGAVWTALKQEQEGFSDQRGVRRNS